MRPAFWPSWKANAPTRRRCDRSRISLQGEPGPGGGFGSPVEIFLSAEDPLLEDTSTGSGVALIELDAAEFNSDTQEYKSAIGEVNKTIAKLQKHIDEIDDAIKILDNAGKVFKAVDTLLNAATKFGTIF